MAPKVKNTGIDITSTSAGASADVLYTVPPRHSGVIRFLTISNSTASPIDVTVEMYHAEDAAYYDITNTTSLAANSVFYVTDGNALLLNASDKIVISGSVSSGLSSFISVDEQYTEAVR